MSASSDIAKFIQENADFLHRLSQFTRAEKMEPPDIAKALEVVKLSIDVAILQLERAPDEVIAGAIERMKEKRETCGDRRRIVTLQ